MHDLRFEHIYSANLRPDPDNRPHETGRWNCFDAEVVMNERLFIRQKAKKFLFTARYALNG